MPNFFQDILNRAKGITATMPTLGSFDYSKEEKRQIAPDITKQTIIGTGNFFKDVAQAFTRGGARVGLEIGKVITGKKEAVITPKTIAEKIIFGEKPITGFKEYGEEILGAFGVGKETAQKYGFGLPLGIALTGLDIWVPGVGKKQIIEKIAKETSESAIKNLLLKNVKNIPKEAFDDLAKFLVKVTDPKEVETILKQAPTITPEAQKGVAPALKAEKGVIPQELQPLAQEARKFKSAEEFVKGIKPEDYTFSDSFGGSVSATIKGNKADIYDAFAKEPGHAVFENAIKDLSNRGINTIEVSLQTIDSQGAIKSMTRKGLLTNPRGGDPRVFGGGSPTIFDIQGAKTKSQLTDFYNQAVKGVKEVAEEAPKGFKWTERGFITSIKEELPELKVAGQYVPRSTDRLAIKAKNLIKDDIKVAEKMALSGIDDDAVATGAELLKHYSDEAAKATDETIKDALYDKAAKLGNTMARNLTEQGRSVQAASILGRLTPEGQVRFAAREIQRFNEEVVKTKGGILGLQKKIPEITGEQVKYIETEMKAIGELAEGTEKAMRFQKLQNYISDLVPTPLFKKMIAVWKAGLLTGIKTSGLNIFANVFHAGTEIVKDIPTTIVDKVVSLFTGKRTKAFTLRGLFGGAKGGVEKGWQYLTTGFDERNIGAKLDYKRINFGKGKLAQGLQAYTDSVFRLLGTEDQPFYYAAKLRSLYEQAKVGAINKGLKGTEAQKFIDDLIQNPTEQMIKYASIDAETAVFQNKTLLGQAARKIQEIPGGEVIVPFGRTPSSVAMQIVNYSPIGIAKTIFENVGRGRFDQRLFSQGMGRGLTGTAVLALGTLLFKKGMMTLDRPIGEKEQKLWELEGKKANAIYDPVSKKWRSVQVLGPAGNVLLIGGHFQNAFNQSGSPTEAIITAMAGSSKSFSEQTFLTGVSNFIDAVSDPARSAESVAGSTLASSIPTIVADIARATDDRERRANEIFEKFQARIPGVRETLEPQITVLGEEKKAIGNPLEIMADPTRPSPAQSTPLVQELRRLWDAGFKVSPTLLGDKKGYEGLTPEQNTQLWKKAGEVISEKLSNLIKSPEYQNLPDDEKAKHIEQFVDKAKLNARAGMVLALTEGLQGEQLKIKLSELKSSGLMTREVFNKWQELK